jgi:SAM-dependent methyltransferase
MNSPALLRRQAFSTRLPLNQRLIELARPYRSHFFLANPASQNSYLLLLRYLRNFSEAWFKLPSGRLKVLDWGCGKGFCCYLLNKERFQVLGCDVVRASNDSAFGQETPIIRAEHLEVVPLKDPVCLPFEENSFDIVLSMGVLEHVKDDFASLEEIRRVLKPRGLLFCFFLPNRLSWTQYVGRKRGENYHDRLYTVHGTRQLLARAGFHVEDIWYRQLLPKNSVRYPKYQLFETLDQALVRFTPLRWLTTNIEFVASVPPQAAKRAA